ncbi:glycosyltransferase family 4 protein [Actinotalea sp. M2MS4P-6]|uniref:glycosyltransferase family 4 protein n=1 Tax=Actinotalea sp. M2MS4P-6 TaxID=2983762 RepID=UPI0021E3BED4|nr:glycosyltransferase family 1 protein [Actinotalea sp. M2MS4P-6]MCV2395831.1 glycosyltransferase family 4 protein [Actinotalea sp. M2MS4P-6]
MQRRLAELTRALDLSGPDPRAAVLAFLAGGADAVWLTTATLHARFPHANDVVATQRALELDGPENVLAAIEATVPADRVDVDVTVVRGAVLVDVHQAASSPFTTGIQRVTLEAARGWMREHGAEPVVWDPSFNCLHEPSAAQSDRVDPGGEATGSRRAIVPWDCTYLLPEVALDRERSARIHALSLHARCRTGAVVHDMVPITLAETTDTGVSADFAGYLVALRAMDRLAAVSDATRREVEGWLTMIKAAGHTGPEVGTVRLATVAAEPSDAALAEARDLHAVPGSPLVLCVGSHEPRKNHVAVLRAAQILWRRGLHFNLLFVGGNAWGGATFRRALAGAVADGEPIEVLTNIGEEQLWALYRLARCTVFPSISEGFGLPSAESLASGTPVVTSNFGAMAEVAVDGGALVVDPRDTLAVADAMADLLTDDALHARLVAEAHARPRRSWSQYAEEAWQQLTTPRP